MDYDSLSSKLKEIESKKKSIIFEAAKELEKIDDKKYSELKKKQILSFYKWYMHPSFGNEWLGGGNAIFFTDAIFLLHLVVDKEKHKYLVKKESHLNQILQYMVWMKKMKRNLRKNMKITMNFQAVMMNYV